jgi:uncharacterized RDD family membrane protein YckC
VVSRLGSALVDVVVVILIGVLVLVVVAGARSVGLGGFTIETPPSPVREILFAVLFVLYAAYGWSLNGRTPGQALLGLRTLGPGARQLSFWRAAARAALYVVFPAGLLWVVISRKNLSVQDIVLRTSVVYEWGHVPAHARPAGDR